MDIIIDKSYLEGSNKEHISDLCGSFRVMMPDTLFYELVTTTDGSRQKCFAKIPVVENPLVLIPNIGELLRYENETKNPSAPVYKRRMRVDYLFNDQLASGDFQFTAEQKEIRDDQVREVEDETRSFIGRVEAMKDMFGELSDCENNNVPSVVERIKNNIASDPRLVKEVYKGTISQSNLPIDVAPENIGKNWAIYRWVQVQLLYALDLYKKYQGEIPRAIGEKFWSRAEHDMLDSHYVVLGALADGVASNDENIIRMYKMIRPKGRVVTKGN